MPLAAGQTLSHYEILGPLGAGGMGEVYRARDPRLEREVAIKVLPAEWVEDAERLARFEREARALAALNHPSVAQVYGFDQVAGTSFIAMELVAGEDLADRLERGALPLEEALKLCARIADGLEAAHELGVVHRDLKPGNVVLSARDQPKVLDFGLAAWVERPGSGTPGPTAVSAYDQLTRTGIGMGSPGYMSPEQARGKPVDRRTDLFAFGCVLYECLTGVRTFAGETAADAVAALLERDPNWTRLPANTPPRVRELLARCLAKDPERRQRDAGDAALELRASLERQEWRAAATGRRASALHLAFAALLGGAAVLAASSVWQPEAVPAALERTLRFDIELPGLSLAVSDRTLNELAIAPDGSPIIFVAEHEDHVSMYAHDLTSGQTREFDLGSTARGAIFSPDGQSVAFIDSFEFLAVASVDGTGARRIGKIENGVGGMGAWIDDGRILMPTSRGNHILAYTLDGSDPSLVVQAPEPMLGFDSLAAVPDQEWFLASGWTGNTIDDYRIVAVDPSTGQCELLIGHGSSPRPVGGRYIVFLRGASLMALPFDFERREALGEPRLVVEGVSTDDWGGSAQFAISNDGTLVYAPGTRRGEGRQLVWLSPDGSREAILGEDAYVGGVELAPDGRQLLFNTLRHGREIWALDLEREVVSPIHSPGEAYSGVFSADGSSVFYNAAVLGTTQLREAPIGGGPSRAVLEGSLAPTCITPDGRHLFLDRSRDDGQDSGGDIVILDLQDENAPLTRLLDDAQDDFEAEVSPDGDWVAYASARTGTPQVYLRAIDGSQEWRISDHGWSPRWSHDGESLYFVTELSLIRVQLELDPSGPHARIGQREQILNELSFAAEQGYGIAADGRVAMIELADWEKTGNRLRVISGWLAELDRRFARE